MLAETYLLPGDYNLDGAVTQADFASWKQQFGAGGFATADGNRDGVVDLADYTVWRNNLGMELSASFMAQTTVPEPSTTLLTIVAIACCIIVRRHPRTRYAIA